MGLGNSHRPAIPLPDLFQHSGRTRRPIREHAHGLDVCVSVATVAAVSDRRIAIPPVIDEPLAGHVVIAADDVRRTGSLAKRVKFHSSQPQPPQMLPEGMLLGHSPAQEIERQPAAFVLIVSLIAKRWSAPDATEILGLDELSGRIDLSDFLHRQLDGPALVDECAHHLPFIALVRVPMSIERREAGGRQWFVDRGKGIDPWVPFAYRSRKSRQVVRELWIE